MISNFAIVAAEKAQNSCVHSVTKEVPTELFFSKDNKLFESVKEKTKNSLKYVSDKNNPKRKILMYCYLKDIIRKEIN